METPDPAALDQIQQDFAKLKDIAGATEYPQPPFPWLNLGLGLLLLVGMVMLWRWFKNRKPAENPVPILSPAEVALQALAQCQSDGLGDDQDGKRFTYQVNMILRRYIEAQFDIQAPEQTTEEFLSSSGFHLKLGQRQGQALQHFLEHCDLIKYADRGLDQAGAQHLVKQAIQFIEEEEAP